MVSTAEHCDFVFNEDKHKANLSNERKSITIRDSTDKYSCEVDNVEKIQCADEQTLNYLIPSAESKESQSTSAIVEPDDIRLRIVELNKKGLGPVAIARSLGISRQRASRWIRRHEEKNGFIQVQKNSFICQEKSLSPLSESSLPLLKGSIEQETENSCIIFNSDDVEELQCIDEDSIEVLKSLYMADDHSPELLKVIPHEDCVRDQIVALHKEGLGPTAIARELGITRQRASRWVKRFISDGTIFTKQRIGRPKKLTTEQKCSIRKYIEEKPYATITEVMTVFNLDCSRSTVRTVMKATLWEELT